MDRRVGDYLVKNACVETPPAVAKQSLFIADTRESYWLDLVIRNAVQEFPGWDLYVCAPQPVLDWLRPSFPQMKEIRAELPPRASPETFSAIMYSQEIWKVFDTEFVMIIQTDTVFAPNAASKLPPDLSKDFYGAACGNIGSPTDFVINGGLSLRRVSAFATATAMLTDADRALPEDVGFCGLMRRHPDLFRLPTVVECMHFAIESFGDPSRVVGIHGTDKHYAPPALITATLGGSADKKFVDCVVYDGEPILETRLKLLDSVVDTFVIVEARYTHAGHPKALAFDPQRFGRWMHKIRYLVIDDFPPMPPGFGRDMPWVKDNGEAWWREQYQRDYVTEGIPEGASRVIVSDIDEIPDPARLQDLPKVDGPVHLEMAFLVHQPIWQKREAWARAYVCSADVFQRKTPTQIRTQRPDVVWPRAGWHCSSFFDVDRQIQKIRSFAHREFAGETDPEVIRQRFETGKDPYGRGAVYDCFHTNEHVWLLFV